MRRGLPWLGVAAAALAAVYAVVTQLSLHPDGTDRLRDDAYYIFVFARNLASGQGPRVVDDITTSGVHWLWAFVLAGWSWLSSGQGDTLPRVAPWLGSCCHLLTAAAWTLAGRARPWAITVGLLWLGNPLLLRESQNGQETALACLLLTLLWLLRRRGEALFAWLGVLVVLARTDLWPVVAALSVARHRPASWRALPAPLLALAVVTVLARATGGGYLQDSGLPMAWLAHASFALTEPSWLDWCRREWWYLRPVLLGGIWLQVGAAWLGLAAYWLLRPTVPRSWRWLPIGLVGAAWLGGACDLTTAVVVALLLVWRPRGVRRPVDRALLALGAGLVVMLLVHWAVRWYPRDYYLAPLAVLGAAGLGRARRLPLWLLLAALLQLPAIASFCGEDLRSQEELAMAGRFVDQVVPGRPPLGCFNSGLVTWERLVAGPPAAVQNLDGVVDRRALAALRRGRLAAFLDLQGVGLLLDNPVEFSLDPRLPHACGAWFGEGFDPARDLVELARFDVPELDGGRPGIDSVRLYWRRRAGVPPPLPQAPRWLGPRPGGGAYVLWPATTGAVLETESAAGERRELLRADAATVMVVAITEEAFGTGNLFLRGSSTPLLRSRR